MELVKHLLSVISLCALLALVWADGTQTATKVILGGEWFTTTTTGESGVYLMKDFKDKVLEPILPRPLKGFYGALSCQSIGLIVIIVFIPQGVLPVISTPTIPRLW